MEVVHDALVFSNLRITSTSGEYSIKDCLRCSSIIPAVMNPRRILSTVQAFVAMVGMTDRKLMSALFLLSAILMNESSFFIGQLSVGESLTA